jgi:hypothetical protein
MVRNGLARGGWNMLVGLMWSFGKGGDLMLMLFGIVALGWV